MTFAAEKSMEHIGETSSMKDHDHDLVQELNERLDALWRYDQCIANAEGKDNIKAFWRDMKEQDMKAVERLRNLIAEECKQGCF